MITDNSFRLKNTVGKKPVHNKVISGFKALRQAGPPMAGLEPATERSLQISGRTHKPLCHRRPGQGTVQGGRRRGRQRKIWDNNLKEWTSLELKDILRRAERREG
ncbi:hypothetical protein PoB_003365400 [Plakobranchus ocellatus]|uniref:Uncharacterized protein n=1 Tax=Plakobranchus ocellatus TaxID=259542 RepID=A0AAV4ALD1_9GAST|nr:hypothetical protein PoB_003365400 [Plakobranchus ocellatus]